MFANAGLYCLIAIISVNNTIFIGAVNTGNIFFFFPKTISQADFPIIIRSLHGTAIPTAGSDTCVLMFPTATAVPCFKPVSPAANWFSSPAFLPIEETLRLNLDVYKRQEYGTELPIAVHKNNIFATQFHPEKSGNEGLKVLKNFGNL